MKIKTYCKINGVICVFEYNGLARVDDIEISGCITHSKNIWILHYNKAKNEEIKTMSTVLALIK